VPQAERRVGVRPTLVVRRIQRRQRSKQVSKTPRSRGDFVFRARSFIDKSSEQVDRLCQAVIRVELPVGLGPCGRQTPRLPDPQRRICLRQLLVRRLAQTRATVVDLPQVTRVDGCDVGRVITADRIRAGWESGVGGRHS
jgi:hypothetical protein